MTRKTNYLAATVAAASIAFAAPAFSQQTPPPAYGQQQAESISVSDDTMKEFAKVQQKVVAVQQNYQAEAQQAGDNPAKIAEITKKANEAATKVVEASPISVEQYNQIAMLLPRDQKLQQQYKKVLDY